jgi:hypothetical protein
VTFLLAGTAWIVLACLTIGALNLAKHLYRRNR